ncbi:hypothetical protein [Halobacterium wangiae]|uniref:hypothetical protein n=1 Tax=Halobacterium wangiae TaxID=2902623 RepID=UPI001E4400E1|nr:hypothetical protein [Halobacterium wangiae]
MVSARLATAVAGVVLSLLVSAIIWYVFDVALFFLAVPFVPFLFRSRGDSTEPPTWTCPQCGFSSRNPDFDYCPRDGTRLERR